MLSVSRGRNPADLDSGFVPGMTTSAYASLDSIGTTILFPRAVPQSTNVGLLCSALFIDLEGIGPAMDLMLFDQPIASGGADNAVFRPNDGDMAALIGVVPVLAGDWVEIDTAGSNPVKVAQLSGLCLPLQVPDGPKASSVYGRLVSRGTPTYATALPLIIKLGIAQ